MPWNIDINWFIDRGHRLASYSRATLSSLFLFMAAFFICCQVTWAKTTPSTQGDVSEDVDSALASLFNKSTRYSYTEAMAILARSAANQDTRGMRAEAGIWLTDVPHIEHRTSYLNAYLSYRRNVKVLPQDDIPNLLDPSDPALQELNGALGFQFQMTTDPISDARSCHLLSPEQSGIYFGLDSKGAYVAAVGDNIDSETFERFAIRPEGRQAHVGLKPDSFADRDNRLEAGAQLFSQRMISPEYYEEVRHRIHRNTVAPSVVYVAKAQSPSFEQLLRDLALTDTAIVRVVLDDGSERVERIQLSAEVQEPDRVINIFDFLGFSYAYCAYGPLRR